MAVMDFILGNPDRHAANMMYRGDEIKLIDHGAAFMETFDPGLDGRSFVPYYLRALAGMGAADFHRADYRTKLRALPRIGTQVSDGLTAWLLALPAADIALELYRFGIDAGPVTKRLEMLQQSVAAGVPDDLEINRAWLGVSPAQF